MLPKRPNPKEFAFSFEPSRLEMTMRAAAKIAVVLVAIGILAIVIYNVGIANGMRLK